MESGKNGLPFSWGATMESVHRRPDPGCSQTTANALKMSETALSVCHFPLCMSEPTTNLVQDNLSGATFSETVTLCSFTSETRVHILLAEALLESFTSSQLHIFTAAVSHSEACWGHLDNQSPSNFHDY